MNSSFSNVPFPLYSLRLIPEGVPGKNRLASFLFSFFDTKKPYLIQSNGLGFEVPSLAEPVSRGILQDGHYDSETLYVIKKCLKNNSVFVDIGGNIGFFSIFSSKNLCKNGTIISVEASPGIFEYLNRNITRNHCDNIRAINKAIYSSPGNYIDFFDAPSEKFGMGGLANRFSGSPKKVITTTIDEIVHDNKINRVDLIKIDVEGFELEAFMGGRELLSRSDAPTIVFEFNDWCEKERLGASPGDAQKFLRSLGYKTQTIKGWKSAPSSQDPIQTVGGSNLIAWK